MSIKRKYQTEMIIQTRYNFWNEQSVLNTIKYAIDSSVDIVSLLFKQDEDENGPDVFCKSGSVFFPNSPYPVAHSDFENTDLVKLFIEKAHENGLHVKAWIPQFHDQVCAEQNEEYRMRAVNKDGKVSVYSGAEGKTEYFVNPLHEKVQEYELDFIKYVCSHYDIDSIALDWIRFDSFNMDLSDYTRKMYTKEKGEDPISFDFSVFDNSNYQKRDGEWNEWRTDKIADYMRRVRSVVDPKIKLGAYVLSPFYTECGQDIAKFRKYLDFVEPMAYYSFFGEDVSWLYRKEGITDLCVKKFGSEKGVIPVLNTTVSIDDIKQILQHLSENYPEIDTLSMFYWSCWDQKWPILKEIKHLF